MIIFDLTMVIFIPYMFLYYYLKSYFYSQVSCAIYKSLLGSFVKPVYILTRIYELKTYKRKEDEKNKFSNTNLCTISFYFVLMRSEELCIYVFHIQIAGGLFQGKSMLWKMSLSMGWPFELLFLSICHFNRKLMFQCYHYYLQHPRHILPFVVDLFGLFAFFCSFLPSFSSF